MSRTSKGFSLIEMLIVAFMMSIIGLIASSMMANLTRLQRTIAIRSERGDLQNLLTLTLSGDATCTCQMVGKTFNSTALPTAIHISFTGNTLRATCDPLSPVVAAAGQPVPGTTFGLQVTSLEVTDVSLLQSPNIFRGYVQVGFNESMKPARWPINMVADVTNPANVVVEKCISQADPFKKYFESAPLPMAGGVLITQAHGLGTRPHFVNLTLINKVASNGFVPGDELSPNVMGDIDGAFSLVTTFDDTNVYVRPYNSVGMYMATKAGGYNVYSAYAKWDLKIRAYAW